MVWSFKCLWNTRCKGCFFFFLFWRMGMLMLLISLIIAIKAHVVLRKHLKHIKKRYHILTVGLFFNAFVCYLYIEFQFDVQINNRCLQTGNLALGLFLTVL